MIDQTQRLQPIARLADNAEIGFGFKQSAKALSNNIVIVGNAKLFLVDLQKKYPNVEVIPVTELDLNSALLRKKQPAE